MFKGVEDTYKKNSMLNKAIRKSLNMYFIVAFIMVFSAPILYKTFRWPIIINIFFMIFFIIFFGTLILYTIFKNLGFKFSFKFKTNKENIFKAIIDAEKHDIILIKEWLIKNDCYDIDCIRIYMEHYQNLNTKKEKNNNFWAILAMIHGALISIAVSSDEKIINTLICYTAIILAFGVSMKIIYNGIIDIKSSFTGDDNLYERLEEIFFQLYIDLKLEKEKPTKGKKKLNIKHILKNK